MWHLNGDKYQRIAQFEVSNFIVHLGVNEIKGSDRDR